MDNIIKYKKLRGVIPMITKTNNVSDINEITLTNLKNGEVTLEQLNEIYNKMGFVFVGTFWNPIIIWTTLINIHINLANS